MNKKRITTIIFWLLTAGLFVFLSLNRHSRSGVCNYHCELWADKAGYNVYALKIFAALILAVIIILGQLIYWKYSSDNFFTNPYRGESFTNLSNPQLLKVWFSTNNGLYTYTPGWIFIITDIFVMIFTKFKEGVPYLLFFLLLSYIISSWWGWQFGCGFGHRAFVEYLPAFIVPAISFWRKISFSRILQSVTIIILCAFSFYNIALVYSWDGCWYGGLWVWQLLWQKFISVF